MKNPAGTATSPLLSRASVDSMFLPTLPPAGAATLSGFLPIIDPHLGVPAGATDFSRGLHITTVDLPGKRRSGSGDCEYLLRLKIAMKILIMNWTQGAVGRRLVIS